MDCRYLDSVGNSQFIHKTKKLASAESIENMQDTNGIVILDEVQIGMKCQPHEERQIQHNSVGCYQPGSELK